MLLAAVQFYVKTLFFKRENKKYLETAWKASGEQPTSGEEKGGLRQRKREPLEGVGAIQCCPIPGRRMYEGQKVWVCFRTFSKENRKVLLAWRPQNNIFNP